VLAVSEHGEVAASVGHRFVDHQSAQGQLALLSPSGVARPLALDVQEADFAPDGAVPGLSPPRGDAAKLPAGALAVVRPSERGYRLELPLGTMLVEHAGWLTHPRVSTDGSKVAYLQHPQSNDDGGEVMLVDVASQRRHVLADGCASVAGLAWDPSGEAL
jgi:eukaryotic-like serine/threonine-protein kinase